MEDYFAKLAKFNEMFYELKSAWEEIKEEGHILYRENRELRQANIELKEILQEQKQDKSGNADGYHQHLVQLYQKGFHVCPLDFGEARKGDCLFCQRFVRGVAKEADAAEGEDKPTGRGEFEDSSKG